ncbi:hypothetical protein SAMN05192559_106180 [Halobacillus karajensis]|uniref:Uncharacterized protein n=1 Tax=Halobacillus karajensis TaxID=195088 RepID=A0A024P7H9_9BACI|nr:hypothetical protein [Halobacillus karajensis]CDQ21036.1 hypothetical protein BN982_03399 [Halobacillus karajensis]CDQ24900.1 hypothetical protein BN983_03199 [Halobacillus karajensis]CDQ28740.1 hypothetical protein BN981_03055 [Halobacillus karajensis]SEH97140.1 hypothetical protein SAMN05192559_106180 [Halobacillus karajensis]
MDKRKSSPFDDFWGFRQQEENKKEEKPQPNLPDLFQEASKTWKSVSPMIKPMIDKFKK